MTRQEAVDKLCDVYAGSFDVTRHEEARQPLMATMDFFVHNSKYVLSKKAKLWEANSFEYVYLSCCRNYLIMIRNAGHHPTGLCQRLRIFLCKNIQLPDR